MKILITGGTGLIGRRLTEILQESGHTIRYLSRSNRAIEGVEVYKWNVEEQTIDDNAVKDIDAIIHLAGVSVADKRWSDGQKKQILESRINSAALLGDALKRTGTNPEVIISASGISVYGVDTGDDWMNEEAPRGDGFLADVVEAWETAADKLGAYCDRIVKLRIGVVLSLGGGALEKMAQPVKFGAGAPLGSGRQYISWIHIDDLCQMLTWAVEDKKVSGTYNGVAPEPVTNKELTKAIAKALGRPLLLPNVPGIVLKTMLGEMSVIVLGGNRVSATKAQNEGYQFQYPTVERALNQIYSNN